MWWTTVCPISRCPNAKKEEALYRAQKIKLVLNRPAPNRNFE